ncbi:MAG: hypothetical protein LBC87_07205 [Fibromonadaceae bacterium]|jgi:predicted  nucleic acid-binding Zn-ribbon protein|nr:hypothetical protein [Fibromonadaceae bacterium]
MEINNVWQFYIAALTIAMSSIAALAKHWINKSDEREAKRAAERGQKRDEKYMALEHKVEIADAKAEGVGKSLDQFKNEHKEEEKLVKEIGERVFNIEKNLISREEFFKLQSTVHNVDKLVVEISTILKERTRALV